MKARCRLALLTLLFAAVSAGSGFAASEYDGKIIRRIEVTGTSTMLPEALLFYTDLREGTVYDEEKARREYQRIWQSGLLRNLDMRVEPYEDGVKITIEAKEKPMLRSVEYKGAKKLTDKRIEESLAQNGIRFVKGEPLNYSDMRKAEQILKLMLESKGFKYSEVRTELREVGPNEVALTFEMDPGERIAIRRIRFEDNRAFSDRKLRRALKDVGEPTALNSVKRRHILNEPKLYNSMQNVIDFYRDRGYATFAIMDPTIEVKETGKGRLPRKRAFVSIGMREGEVYKIGDIVIQGNEVLTEGDIRALLTFAKGDTYNHGKIQKFRTAITDAYGKQGYIFAHVGLVPNPDPQTRIVNLTFDIQEDKPYHLRRLTFRGNTLTRDKVLRREMLVSEGELMNMSDFQRSMRKLNNLGFFKPTGPPQITRVEGEEDKVDVNVLGQEERRNEFNFGGGYSGLEGAFLQTSFRSSNFKGRGETAEIMARLGGRQNLYTLSYTWPWIFDRPYLFGASLFRREQRYVQFNQMSTGGSLTFGTPLTYFSRFFLNYTWQRTQIEGRGAFGSDLELISADKLTQVTLTPGYQFDSRNNPYVPSNGGYFRLSMPVAHWVLGSDVSYYKIVGQGTRYFPAFKRAFFAVNAEAGWASPFAKHRLPANERFFLGGAGSIRGFETRSVGPAIDGIVYGGDVYLQANAEFIIPVADIFQFAVFADAGDAWALRGTKTIFRGNLVTLERGFTLSNMPASAGFEARFFMPIFPFPIRFIWSFPIQSEPWQRTRTFEFTIGPVF